MYRYDSNFYPSEERFGGLLLPFVGGLLAGGLFAPGPGPLYPNAYPPSYPPYYPPQVTYQNYNSIQNGNMPSQISPTEGYFVSNGMYY